MRSCTQGEFLPRITCILTFCSFVIAPVSAIAADTVAKKGRQIEEVVVTAEKVESTVSDTSISITAFDSEMIQDFGMKDANDMVNFIPATTRDAYDIRIRGVGKNFRALGGDPGVATYYNGVFSPDFGIAASENALWDLARIEVLRGPQGTLYGRNAIGGALNYVTNDPTFDWTGKMRVNVGNLNDREVYGLLSGPIIADKVAFRLLGIKRDRDGSQEGINGSPDTNSIDDRNLSLSLTWDITDKISLKTRTNDRVSDRVINESALVTEGAAPVRGTRSTTQYAFGLHPVSQGDPGAMAFTDPADGSTVYGAFVRPGVDNAATHQPNGAYLQTSSAALMAGATTDDPNNLVMVEDDGTGACEFPYTKRNCNHEYFGHQSNQTDITWEINDKLSLKYIFGYTDYKYTFNIDEDHARNPFTKYRTTVLEDVQQKSHELQLFWGVGERWTATTGAFWYDEIRQQDYSLSNTIPRYTEPADYGDLGVATAALGGVSVMDYLAGLAGFGTTPVDLYDAPLGTERIGPWGGNPRGDWYHHFNTVRNNSVALYSQGTYEINDKFDVVLGIRYAKDKKDVQEVRMSYIELGPGVYDGFDGVIPFLGGNAAFLTVNGVPAYGVPATPGLTQLALLNIAQGNATYSGDPANPITPVCALDNPACDHPLRLQGGVPYSYTSNIGDSDEWSDTNFRANLDWKPNDNILMYFSVTTGYRAGGYSLGVVGARYTDPDTGIIYPGKYDKETVTSYEIGYKGQHLDNTLQVNLSLYTYRYKNYQDEVDSYDSAQAQESHVVQNADKAINSGFEAELLWLATDALTLGGNYSLTKTKYDSDYPITVVDDPNLPASLFGDAESRPDLFLKNARGSQLKKIPETKATVWASYLYPTGMGDFTFRGNYSYTGKYYDQGYERAIDMLPSRVRLDLSATWQDKAQHWAVRAYVDNVTDEHNLRDISSGTESSNWALTGAILDPRLFGLDVTYKFTP